MALSRATTTQSSMRPRGVAPSSSGNTLLGGNNTTAASSSAFSRRASKWLPSQCRPARAAPGTRRPAAEGHPATPPRRYSAARPGAARHLCGVAGHQFAQAIHLAQHPPALFVDPQSAGGGFERLGIAVQQCHPRDSSRLCTRRVIADWSGPGSRRPGSGKRCGSPRRRRRCHRFSWGRHQLHFSHISLDSKCISGIKSVCYRTARTPGVNPRMSSILRLDRLRQFIGELATLLDSRPDESTLLAQAHPCWPSWCARTTGCRKTAPAPIHSATNSTCCMSTHGSASRWSASSGAGPDHTGTRSSGLGPDRHARGAEYSQPYAFDAGASASQRSPSTPGARRGRSAVATHWRRAPGEQRLQRPNIHQYPRLRRQYRCGTACRVQRRR